MDAFERAANESAAIALLRAGNVSGAEARLRTMLSIDPNDARALALLAHCRIEAKEDREALAIARNAAAIEPDDPLVRSTLSLTLLRGGKGKKERQEALGIAEDVAAESPEDSDALFSLAIARFNTKDYHGARALFDDAEKHAGSAFELINVAQLRLEEWNYDTAQSLAQRAMQLDPTRPDVFRILAEVALARKQPLDAYELALEALRLAPGDRQIMRLLTRARARAKPWLRPFARGADWIVEMDRRGLVIVPLAIGALGFVFAVSLMFDLARIEAGRAPAVVLSLGAGGLLVYAVVSYAVAIGARMRIRRDLRKVALPDF